MKYCRACGTANEDDCAYCRECGTKFDTPPQTPTPGSASSSAPASEPTMPAIDTDAVKEALTDAADKTMRGAKSLAETINTTVTTTLENQKTKANEAAQKKIDNAQKRGSKPKSTPMAGNSYMSSTELWSWLQRSSKRQLFFTEEENPLSREGYMRLLAEKLDKNKVPAKVSARQIQWDRSDVKQGIYYVEPISEAVNPLTCLIQFNHVGKFTFVEEKTFITPPNLPEVPQKKVPIPQDLQQKSMAMLYGAALVIGGLLLTALNAQIGLIAALVGAVMAVYGFTARAELKTLKEHNEKCAKQERAWNAAWSNWENSIFEHSFQESVNGQIGRIFDSVFECIRQLNNEQFSEKASDDEEESKSMNELEQLISRRKNTYR